MSHLSPDTTPEQTAELREQIEHMFVSAFQDGFGCATNPKYRNRTAEHTERAMELIAAAHPPQSDLEQILGELPDHDREGIHATYGVSLMLGGKIHQWLGTWECDTGEYVTVEADTPLQAAQALKAELLRLGIMEGKADE